MSEWLICFSGARYNTKADFLQSLFSSYPDFSDGFCKASLDPSFFMIDHVDYRSKKQKLFNISRVLEQKGDWTSQELHDLVEGASEKPSSLFGSAFSTVMNYLWVSSPLPSSDLSGSLCQTDDSDEPPSDTEFLSHLIPSFARYSAFTDMVESVICLAGQQLEATINKWVTLTTRPLKIVESQRHETSLEQIKRDRYARDTEIRLRFLTSICSSHAEGHDEYALNHTSRCYL